MYLLRNVFGLAVLGMVILNPLLNADTACMRPHSIAADDKIVMVTEGVYEDDHVFRNNLGVGFSNGSVNFDMFGHMGANRARPGTTVTITSNSASKHGEQQSRCRSNQDNMHNKSLTLGSNGCTWVEDMMMMGGGIIHWYVNFNPYRTPSNGCDGPPLMGGGHGHLCDYKIGFADHGDSCEDATYGSWQSVSGSSQSNREIGSNENRGAGYRLCAIQRMYEYTGESMSETEEFSHTSKVYHYCECEDTGGSVSCSSGSESI